MGNILVTTITEIFPEVLRYKGRRIAIQIGGVLRYKWGSTDNISLSFEPRGTKSTAMQSGGVLQHKGEVYRDSFFEVVVAGPKIDKIQDRPPGLKLKFSSDIENFKRAAHQAPRTYQGYWP